MSGGRSASKTLEQIKQVIDASSHGDRVILHAQHWVMMSRDIYQEMKDNQIKTIGIKVDEARDLYLDDIQLPDSTGGD